MLLYAYCAIRAYHFGGRNIFIPVVTLGNGIPTFHGTLEGNACKTRAANEGIGTNASYTIGNDYAGQAVTVLKSFHTNSGYASRDVNAIQACAGAESIVSYGGKLAVLAESHASQVIASDEGSITNGADVVRDGDVCQTRAVCKGIRANVGHASRYSELCQIRATFEGRNTNSGKLTVLAESHASQTRAVSESAINVSNTIRDGETCQTCAT